MLMLAVCGGDAFAKGGFGGGRSSSFRSSPTRSFSSPKSTPTKSSPSKVSTSGRTSVVGSKTDVKSYQTAKQNGKAFTTKAAAVKDFKAKAASDPKVKQQLAKDYPTSYATQPATRPAHIPEKYSAGGNTYNVTYQNGGYGYMGPNGFTMLTSYMLLDTMSDAMLMSSMSRQGYHVGPPVVNSGPSVLACIMLVLFATFVIVIIIATIEA